MNLLFILLRKRGTRTLYMDSKIFIDHPRVFLELLRDLNCVRTVVCDSQTAGELVLQIVVIFVSRFFTPAIKITEVLLTCIGRTSSSHNHGWNEYSQYMHLLVAHLERDLVGILCGCTCLMFCSRLLERFAKAFPCQTFFTAIREPLSELEWWRRKHHHLSTSNSNGFQLKQRQLFASSLEGMSSRATKSSFNGSYEFVVYILDPVLKKPGLLYGAFMWISTQDSKSFGEWWRTLSSHLDAQRLKSIPKLFIFLCCKICNPKHLWYSIHQY